VDQDCTCVEKVKSATLDVLLGFGPRLGGYNSNTATRGRSVSEADCEQRAMDTVAAMGGRRGGAGQLRDAVGHVEARSAGDGPFVLGDVAEDASGCEISLGPLDDLAWKVLV
jgi:hypothetical protein